MVNFDKVRSLLNQERFQDAYALLQEEEPAARSVDANRLLGLACRRMNRHAEAAGFYELVCAQSKEADDWFNLAMARLLGGDPVHAIVAIEEAKRLHSKVKDAMSWPMMLFHFIGGLLDTGMWDAAKRYLKDLAEIYVQLGTTEDKLLYAQNVPYFSWMLNAALSAYRNSNSQKAGAEWLNALSARLDLPGQGKVKNAVQLLLRPQAEK